jgi:hypothetical protein
MSYTEELTQLIIDEYSADPTRATVDRLAEEHGKSARSIIAISLAQVSIRPLLVLAKMESQSLARKTL